MPGWCMGSLLDVVVALVSESDGSDQTPPSPSLGPPLLSPSMSPPFPCGMPAVVGGGAGAGAELCTGAGADWVVAAGFGATAATATGRCTWCVRRRAGWLGACLAGWLATAALTAAWVVGLAVEAPPHPAIAIAARTGAPMAAARNR